MRNFSVNEFRVVALREAMLPSEMLHCDTPEKAVEYWRSFIEKAVTYNPEVENFFVLMVNTRRRIKAHALIAHGTQDTLLVHPREVYRPAIIAGASAIVIAHNHPSGESDPSEADIKVTRDLMRAGQLLKIELLDHIIIGVREHTSLRALGHFYS